MLAANATDALTGTLSGLPSPMSNLSVIDPPFLVGLGLLTAVVVVASWFRTRHRWLRWGVRALGIVLALLMTASAINARYAYLPTVSAVFGRTATDQVSLSQLRHLEQAAGVGPGALQRLARPASSEMSHGVVVPFTIPGVVSHFHARTAEVYLPPAYFGPDRQPLPVIELLHGTPGSPADWTRAIFADVVADAYAARHDGVAPILVMPDVNGGWSSDSECVDGTRGNAQTYLTVDVRNAVVARFHSRRDGGGWGIVGFSEGGMCALQIGLRHPAMYWAIGDYSGDPRPSAYHGAQHLFGGTVAQATQRSMQYDPMQLLQHWNSTQRPAIWFEVGTFDGNMRSIERLDLLAGNDGFATRFVPQPGETHGFAAWRSAFADSFHWLADLLTLPPTNAPNRA